MKETSIRLCISNKHGERNDICARLFARDRLPLKQDCQLIISTWLLLTVRAMVLQYISHGIQIFPNYQNFNRSHFQPFQCIIDTKTKLPGILRNFIEIPTWKRNRRNYQECFCSRYRYTLFAHYGK